MDDEYELLAHDEIEKLKKEAERYKNNPFIKNKDDEKLYASIINLTNALNKMSSVFEDVKQEILQEQEKGEGPDSKLERLLSQNKSIAEALVAFNEKIDSLHLSSKNTGKGIDEGVNDNMSEGISKSISESTDNGISESNKYGYGDVNFPNSNDFMNESNFSNSNLNKDSMNNSNFNNSRMEDSSNSEVSSSDDINTGSKDMDYKSWNYGNPSKPGVSRSSQKDIGMNQLNQQNTSNGSSFNNENQHDRNNKIDNRGFGNQQDKFSQGFNQNNQDEEFDIQQPNYVPEPDLTESELLDLRLTKNEKPKRRKFGLF